MEQKKSHRGIQFSLLKVIVRRGFDIFDCSDAELRSAIEESEHDSAFRSVKKQTIFSEKEVLKI